MSTLVRAPAVWCRPGHVMEDAVVLVVGGRIDHVGPADEAIEADDILDVDGFVMPAVADRHVHIALSDPGAVLLGGVTAVRDLGWPPEAILPLAEASESPAFNGPLIRAVGPILTSPGGYPSRSPWAPPGTAVEVRGVDEAAEAAGRVLTESGAPVLKVALNADAGPTLGDRELVAICETAHERGAIVTAHVQGRGEAERAVGAGVDEFAHCPWSERLPDALIETMAGQMRIVSTLEIQSFGRETPELETALENLRRFVHAGGRVAYGTDLGNGPIPPGVHVDEAVHLHEAGVRGDDLLHAMTFRPVATGEPADLVAFAGDPREDVSWLGELRLVMRGGRVVRGPGSGA